MVAHHEEQHDDVDEVGKAQVECPEDPDAAGAGAYFVQATLVVGNLGG